MYKPMIDNPQYLISLTGSIFDTRTNSEVSHAGVFEASIADTVSSYDVLWLARLSHYEVCLSQQLRNRIFDITFVPVARFPIRSNSAVVMVFKSPIHITDDFRIIPNFTRYAIARCGKIFDTILNKVRTVSYITSDAHYPSVNNIWNPDKLAYKHAMPVHRLLAYAWVENSDWSNKTVVNHIDCDKRNYNIDNLEWITQRQNNIHAVNANCVNSNIKCIVRDYLTDTTTEYSSISQMREHLKLHGVDRNRILSRQYGALYKDRYEIRLENDTRPWMDSVCCDLTDNVRRAQVEGPYTVLDLRSMTRVQYTTTRSVASAIGVTASTVLRHIHNPEIYAIGSGYVVCKRGDETKLDTINGEALLDILLDKCSYIVIGNDTQHVVPSLRQLAKFFQVDRKKIVRLIRDRESYMGYTILQVFDQG
jgi:hypothetical protein